MLVYFHMFENHMLQPQESRGLNLKKEEDLHFKLDVSLEELEELTEGDEELEKILNEVLSISLDYTETVFEMEKIAIENKNNDASALIIKGHERRTIHNNTIEKINELAKKMEEKDISNSWINRLNPDKFADNRAVYGRFAIAVTFYRIANE